MVRGKRQLAVGLQIDGTALQLSASAGAGTEPEGAGERRGQGGYLLPEAMSRAFLAQQLSAQQAEELADVICKALQEELRVTSQDAVRLMITVPRLWPDLWEKLPEALTKRGLERKHIFLQDYLSSFFYYAVNQKKELWAGDVALLSMQGAEMVGYLLHIDRSKTPALAQVGESVRQPVTEVQRDGRDEESWDKERDRLLFELLKKLFERRRVVSCYVVSDYYDRSWAQRSFQFLCQNRHAFQGENLYTRGACYGAMARAGMLRMPDLLFLGADIVQSNLGMVLRVRGREMYYPLVSAGVNWYEAHHECELLPDGEEEIVITSTPMDGGEEVARILRLKDFPQRPRRATRLRLSLYFTAPDCAVAEVEDLGFGELYRSSGRSWKRRIML